MSAATLRYGMHAFDSGVRFGHGVLLSRVLPKKIMVSWSLSVVIPCLSN